MKRLALFAALAAVALTSCAATLRVNGVAPAQDNEGSCVVPALVPRSGALVVHIAWSGTAAGEDSVVAVGGAPFSFSRTGLAEGNYTVRIWASDAGGAGCDTTVTKYIGSPPWKVTL